jgi:hypothetical protein
MVGPQQSLEFGDDIGVLVDQQQRTCAVRQQRRLRQRRALPEQRQDALGRHGAEEKRPLHLVAAELAQQRVFVGGLDAVGADAHAEGVQRAEDLFGHGRVVGDRHHVLHEGRADVDAVEREGLQRADGERAGAEIGQRQADAAVRDLLEDRQVRGGVLAQDRFGDLQADRFRRQVVVRQHGAELVGQLRVVELALDEFDVDAHAVAAGGLPAAQVDRRAAQHRFADVEHAARVEHQRHEAARGQRAEQRVFPAQQRFHGHHAAVAGIDHRLVMQAELAGLVVPVVGRVAGAPLIGRAEQFVDVDEPVFPAEKQRRFAPFFWTQFLSVPLQAPSTTTCSRPRFNDGGADL